MITTKVVKSALTRLLKSLYPSYNIFYEDPDLKQTPLFYVEIIPVGAKTFSATHTDKTIAFDIGCQTESRKKHEYNDIAETIDGAIRPVFRFAGRSITVNHAEWRVVDGMLHYTFSIAYRDSFDIPDDPDAECGGELQFNIRSVE